MAPANKPLNAWTKERNEYFATADTSVVTPPSEMCSESSLSSCDQDTALFDYGYGDSTPGVAAKHGYEDNSPGNNSPNPTSRFDLIPASTAPGTRRASMSNGECNGTSLDTSNGDNARSRRASIQFGSLITPPPGFASTDVWSSQPKLEDENTQPVAQTGCKELDPVDRTEGILATMLENSIRSKPVPRRSSMPFCSLSDSHDLSTILSIDTSNHDASVNNKINKRSLLRREDSLIRTLQSDLENGFDFASERYPARTSQEWDIGFGFASERYQARSPQALRRSSMPWSNTVSITPDRTNDREVLVDRSIKLEKEETGSQRSLPSLESISSASCENKATTPSAKPTTRLGYHHKEAECLKQLPGSIYSVKFKRDTKDAFLGAHLGNHDLPIGAYVKVKGDRGIDLGIIVAKSSSLEYQAKNQCIPEFSEIICCARQDEVAALPMLRQEEQHLLWLCRDMAYQLRLPMTVVDAEFQFDRNKLTFYYEAGGRIDFRDLVRWLYSTCGVRIWMCQIFTTRPRQFTPTAPWSPRKQHKEPATPIIAPQSEWLC